MTHCIQVNTGVSAHPDAALILFVGVLETQHMANVMRQPLRDGIADQSKRLRAPPFGWIEVNATACGTPWEAGVSHAAKLTTPSATGDLPKLMMMSAGSPTRTGAKVKTPAASQLLKLSPMA
jgi:hypothetical protein